MSVPPPAHPFYPLANPRGTDYRCEICTKAAFLQCSLCRVTYYCDTNHQKVDWVGIHEKLCNTLKELRKPAVFISSEDERRKRKEELHEKHVEMITLTEMTGRKLLFEGKAEEAVPAALQCLKFTVSAHGLASVELVPPYLILAESSIVLDRLCEAEAYLAQAQWTVLKLQHACSNNIRSQLFRKLGLFYTMKRNYAAALEALAQDIFYASCEFGPNHIRTAGGYFQLAEVFKAMHQDEQSLSKMKDEHQFSMLNVCAAEADKSTGSSRGSKPSRPATGILANVDPGVGSSQLLPSAAPRIPGAPPYAVQEVLTNTNTADLGKLDQSCGALTTYASGVYVTESEIAQPRDKLLVAEDLYARVVEMWANYLAGIVQAHSMQTHILPKGIGAVVAEITRQDRLSLDEAQQAEVVKVLSTIKEYRKSRALNVKNKPLMRASGRPDPECRLAIALCLLYIVLNDAVQAQKYFEETKVLLEKHEPHEILIEHLKIIESAM